MNKSIVNMEGGIILDDVMSNLISSNADIKILFGDDYRRGVFLVNMQREHIMAGNECGRELPDHLPNVLTLLPLISDKAFVEELICSLLIPALTEMIRRFRKIENYYRSLLEILLCVMESDFPSSSYERFQFTLKNPVQ
jgi:nitrate reductase assembly molybdenum cofactor insertion protein NarJ